MSAELTSVPSLPRNHTPVVSNPKTPVVSAHVTSFTSMPLTICTPLGAYQYSSS